MAPVNGGGRTTISSDVQQSTQVAVDATGVYFTRWSGTYGGQVEKAPLGGGPPVVVASGDFLQNLVSDGEFVYWTESTCTRGTQTSSSSLAGRVVKAPNDGGPPVTIAGGFFGPSQIAVDQTNVYWLTSPCSGSPSIMKMHK